MHWERPEICHACSRAHVRYIGSFCGWLNDLGVKDLAFLSEVDTDLFPIEICGLEIFGAGIIIYITIEPWKGVATQDDLLLIKIINIASNLIRRKYRNCNNDER